MHKRAVAAYVAELAEAGARSAKLTECQRCGEQVLRGDDDDDIAYRATVDLDPVDHVGEMLAHLDGRPTYDLVKATGRGAKPGVHNLYHRDDWHVAKAHRKYLVLAAHRCNPDTGRLFNV